MINEKVEQALKEGAYFKESSCEGGTLLAYKGEELCLKYDYGEVYFAHNDLLLAPVNNYGKSWFLSTGEYYGR